MILLFALAAALLPIGDVPPGACVDRTSLADVQPQGAGTTFVARRTTFARNFAYTKFYEHENGGGEILWRRRGAQWCAVPHERHLDNDMLVRLGVPVADARRFGLESGHFLEAVMWARRHEPTAKSDGD